MEQNPVPTHDSDMFHKGLCISRENSRIDDKVFGVGPINNDIDDTSTMPHIELYNSVSLDIFHHPYPSKSHSKKIHQKPRSSKKIR